MKMFLYEEVRREAAARRSPYEDSTESCSIGPLAAQLNQMRGSNGDGWVFTPEDERILMLTRRWVQDQDTPTISPVRAYGLLLERRRCP